MEKKASPNYYSAVVVINTSGEVLLGKRKEDGIWTTPAGGSEPGEESPSRTAVRELFEEAGIAADSRFLQPIMQRITRNGKFCHVFLHVVPAGIMTTSNMDPDQEVKTWKWFSMDKIPSALRDDMRRWDSVMAGYMKFHGITKSLTESLEKGGKPAQIGEVRNFGGKDYKKMGNGQWEPVVHPEEKQLQAEQSKKVVSLTSKLKEKIEQKNEVSHGEKALHDMKNQVVLEGKETRSGKPMFSNVDAALAHGYKVEDFREVANVFYDRAQAMANNIQKLSDGKQKIDPNFEKLKKENMKAFRSFLGQALRIENREKKSKMAKSTVGMVHLDGAEINTADFAIESKLAGEWLDRLQMAMQGYDYGEVPRIIPMETGDLNLVKVDEGMYSGVFRSYTQTPDGLLEDNAKVRIERMTLPSLVQFCLAKEWIRPMRDVTPEIAPEPAIQSLTAKLEEPLVVAPGQTGYTESFTERLNARIRLADLLTKLLS